MSAYTTTESVDLVLGVTSDFSLGETLVSVHYVLGMVFKYLRYKDLESASKVNVKWKEVAVKEMEGRNVVNHFSCKRGEDWIRFINQGYYKSKVHVVFLNQIHILIIRGYNKYMTSFPDAITLSFEIYLELQTVKDYFDFEGVSLPDIPQTRIAFSGIYEKTASRLFLNHLSVKGNETFNSVIILSSETDPSEYLKTLLTKQKHAGVAVAGGILIDFFQKVELPYVIILTFLHENTESPNLLSYSLVVPNGTAHLKDQFEKFKNETTLRSQSVAFRFSQKTENANYDQNLDATFKLIFPKTHLLGLNLRKQIAWDEKEGEAKFVANAATFLLLTWQN